VASRLLNYHLSSLFSLFNLRARYPELANHPGTEQPLTERARKASEICIQWMAHGGVQLDGTVESLRVLDEQISRVWTTLNEEKN